MKKVINEKTKDKNVLQVVEEIVEVDVEEISQGQEEEEEEELLNDHQKKIQTSLPTKTGSILSTVEENEESPLQSCYD